MDLNRETITFASEAEWLAERELDLTSTEVAALFGCSPYLTEYELFHRKTGQLAADFSDNDRMKWGRRLEAAIAEGVAEDLGLVVEPYKVYRRITDLRMGSSFDFRIIGLRDDWKGGDETYRDLFRQFGEGLMEVKNVDGLAFRRGWVAGEDTEAPAHIELQVQHQMETDDTLWAVVAPLINGNTPHPFWRLRDYEVGKAIRAKVAEFWNRVDTGNPPTPNFEEDAQTIALLHVNSNDETVDMTDNTHLAVLCYEYYAAGHDEKEAKKRKDAAKAEILTIIGEAGKVIASGFNISAGTIKENPGTLITDAMIGQRYGARRSYRNVRINVAK